MVQVENDHVRHFVESAVVFHTHFAIHFLWATTKRFLGVGRHDEFSRLGMASATCRSLAPSPATYRTAVCRR